MDSKTPKYVSLFTGAGGLDLGLRVAGFEGLLSVENDQACRGTLRENDPGVNMPDQGDITRLPSTQLLEFSRLKKNELDLLVGGPPCQPFSKSGYWAN